MKIESNLLTRKQLERKLSQALQSSYRDLFGHSPTNFVCHIFDNKISILIENAITMVEKFLLENTYLDTAINVRSAVDKIFILQVETKIK